MMAGTKIKNHKYFFGDQTEKFSHEEASSRWDESEREAEFWRGVLKAAKRNPALREELDKVKAFYILSASSLL